MRRALVGLLAIAAAYPSTVTGQPAMPIVSESCPMECCMLGNLTAPTAVAALRTPDRRADTAFLSQRGDTVVTTANRMVITKPGIIAFTSPYTIKAHETKGFSVGRERQISFAAGDTIFNIALVAEATDAWFWYRGQTYHADGGDLDIFSVHAALPSKPYRVESEPTYEWWVRAHDRRGRTGWFLNPSSFGGAGRCG